MPRPATFGIWTELRPGNGRQPDPGFYAERLEEAVLAEQLGLAAVWAPHPRRGRLLEEKLGVLRRALAEGVIGDGPDGPDLPVGPRSPQEGGPPLYLGGTALK